MTESDNIIVPTDDVEVPPPCTEGLRIFVSNDQSLATFDVDLICEITTTLLQAEGFPQAEIGIAVVDDAAIHEINRLFLNHDYPTDVISFLLSEPCVGGAESSTTAIEGEIVISGETAARVANEVGCPAHEELALYLVHGLLHLCGYDDQAQTDQKTMRSREQFHLQKFGIEPHY